MSALMFGKYKGKTIQEIATIKQGKENGVSYLTWLRDNSDPNDPKYGEKNKALRAEIDSVLSVLPKQTKYVKDNSQLPRGDVSGQIEKKIDFLTDLFKKAYPDVYNELMFENSPKDEAPF